MPARERSIDRGRARGRIVAAEMCREIREARLDRGLDQATVARAVGLSRSEVSRIERGLVDGLTFDVAARLLSVVGLELSARAYPSGRPARDAAHAALLARLCTRLHPSLGWRPEVPIGGPGDLRAWDAVVVGTGWRIGVEAETRPRDVQGLLRRIALKQRDGHIDMAILLLAASRHDRDLVRSDQGGLRSSFPFDGPRALELLAAGVAPEASSIILL
jgi:transcriptional regulator with XRE-family HTH domain